VVSLCAGSDWPQWRGPRQNGASDETSLPASLDGQSLLWKAPLPGPAASTPVIADGRVYLSSTKRDSAQMLAMCFDASSGKEQWSKTIAGKGQTARRNNFGSCSPVAYKGGAVFLFGDGTLARLDAEGKMVWSRNLVDDYGPLAIKFGFSSSPLLYDGKLYIPVLRQPKTDTGEALASYLLCADAGDGKTIFKYDRSTDAVGEAHDAYTTALAAAVKGQTQIIVYGGDYLTAHHPDTGEELWRYCYAPEHINLARLVSSPTLDGTTLVCVSPRGKKTFAVDIEKLTDRQSPMMWSYEDNGPDVPSPVLYRGCVYIIDERGKILKCLNASDGTQLWTGSLDKSDVYYASITAADGKLYAVNRKGAVTVVAADPNEFRVLSSSLFEEAPVDSTIAVADGKVYLRTAESLYCFGKK